MSFNPVAIINGLRSVPKSIDAQVQAFCANLRGRIAAPEYVRVETAANSQLDDCFNNVQRRIAAFGGTDVNGWMIWYWPGVVISAEHHCCWQKARPPHELVDVSPQPEPRIVFVRSKIPTPYGGAFVPNVYKNLHGSTLVDDWITASRQFENTVHRHGFYPSPELASAAKQLHKASTNLLADL